ncbi:hypothetical protein PG994_003351 [Apiospora phragmitis]|uniref:Protein kinase domain-containing protein n=1 Tax=Apiospora phragmitis TaxID=2905665 RepID=A0ABR1VXZ2_9PEZI
MAGSQGKPDVESIPTAPAFTDLDFRRYNYPRDDYDDPHGFESFENYQPGGFCPIDLSFGSKPSFIIDRFEVIYKLSYGGFGTVWLCYEHAVKKWRAVKVGRASATEEHSGEILVESIMKQHSAGVAEALDNNIVLPLETFWIDSVSGRHLCTVLPFLGPRLSDWVKWLKEDDPEQYTSVCCEWLSKFVSDKIAIVDFGEAYLTTNPNARTPGIPGFYAAPEILFDGQLGIGTDIWALARAILEFRPRSFLSMPGKTFVKLREMKEFAGPCPPPFRQPAQKRDLENPAYSAYFSKYLVYESKDRPKQEEYDHHIDQFLGMEWPRLQLSREETLSLGELLQNKFRWHPEERWQTDRILAHRWFSERHQPAQLRNIDDFWPDRSEVQSSAGQDDFATNSSRELTGQGSNTALSKSTTNQQPVRTSGNESEVQPLAGQDDIATNSSREPTAHGSNTALSESTTDRQPVNPPQKAIWHYFQLFTVVFYLSGVTAMIAFFFGHMLANQPGFYKDRPRLSSHDTAGPIGPVVQHVVVILILQA